MSAPTTPLPLHLHWQPALGTTGDADGFVRSYDDLRQSVRVILETRLGSDPLRPNFGSRLSHYLDWPLERARPHIVRETVAAIRLWEPRVRVTRVQVERASDNPAHVLLTVGLIAADGVEISAIIRPA